MQKSFTNGLYQEASFMCFLNRLLKLLDNVPNPDSLLYSLIEVIKICSEILITAISFSFIILAVSLSDVTVSVTFFSDNTSFALSQ